MRMLAPLPRSFLVDLEDVDDVQSPFHHLAEEPLRADTDIMIFHMIRIRLERE